MIKFILRRLFFLIPMMFIASAVIFIIMRLSPNDPALEYLHLSNIPPTEEMLIQIRAMLGLDQPILIQYINWLSKIIHLDFGFSYVTKRPVFDEFLYFLPFTLKLAGASLLFVIVFSIPLGIWSARYRNKLPDKIIRIFSILGVSMPNFWLAFILLIIFSKILGILPVSGYGGIQHMIMPILTISFMSLAINTRLLRSNLLETSTQRHVIYAKLRGISYKKIEINHILRNALIPIVTALGMHLGELIGGAIIIETIFALPGIGLYAVSAINNKDYPVIECFTLMMTAVFVLCNLLVDILYAFIDPRIKQ